jgi:hypothetical protein
MTEEIFRDGVTPPPGGRPRLGRAGADYGTAKHYIDVKLRMEKD